MEILTNFIFGNNHVSEFDRSFLQAKTSELDNVPKDSSCFVLNLNDSEFSFPDHTERSRVDYLALAGTDPQSCPNIANLSTLLHYASLSATLWPREEGYVSTSSPNTSCASITDYDSNLGNNNANYNTYDLCASELNLLLNMYNGVQIDDPAAGIENGLVISGGFQQYLIRNRDKIGVETEQPRKGRGSDKATFHDLPDSLQLQIYSFLTASDLCRVAAVSRHWQMLSSDDLLWKKLLKLDSKKWHVVGHNTNPSMYEECQSDWSYKDIYLRCSPEVNRLIRQQNMNFHQLSTILRSLWPKKTPRVAMFGPGLESETSGLTRKIIELKSGIFEATGMFPGQFDGVGSGFTMKITASGLLFNLVTLYTSTRDERERRQHAERLQHSRLLASRSKAEGVEGVEPHYELQEPIRNLCRTLDGLIFVVDASLNAETIAMGRPELMAMVSEMWANPDIPVLVLSCVREYSITRVSCINVVDSLQLGKLNRPWQVHDCVVDSLAGVQQGIQWLIEQTHRR